MDINSLLSRVVGLIKYDGKFSKISVIQAYPSVVKSTRLNKICVAVGISGVNLHPSQIDSPARAGEVSVFVDIFIPFKMDGIHASDVFIDICDILSRSYNVMSVSASRLAVDECIQASVLKTSFTIYDQISFGGDDY